MQQPATR